MFPVSPVAPQLHPVKDLQQMHTYTPQEQDKERRGCHIIDVYCLCIYVYSLRERSAEQASEAGLRRNHSVSEGSHSGLGEDAGNSWEGKGQI